MRIHDPLTRGQPEQAPRYCVAESAPGRDVSGEVPATEHHGTGDLPDPVRHGKNVSNGVLTITVSADHIVAGKLCPYEGETTLQRVAFAAVDGVTEHMAPKAGGVVERVLVARAGAVVHYYDGQPWIGVLKIADEDGELVVRLVGRDQDDHDWAM
ncbi:hypothetical protein ARTHRO9V_40086 [Arthrobacter sp. 9V]|nr:hypothetical protein ARTHRO9V_40086 [Arthrobacter sp. 9V]